MNAEKIYGVVAELDSAEALLNAVKVAIDAGYREIEAYSPFPVKEVAEALGQRHNRVPLLTLIGGLLGAAVGLFLQWYSSVVDYPMNIGGRPYFSLPAFMPAAAEMALLGAAVFAVVGMIVLNGLPRLYHPLFDVPRFARVTTDRFFLCIRSRDAKFDRRDTRRLLISLHPIHVTEVAS